MYHVVAEHGATACGIPEDVHRPRCEGAGELGRVKTFSYRPTSYFPCKRCEIARAESEAGTTDGDGGEEPAAQV